MRICIVVDVDEEVADPTHHSGLTRQAYAQVTEAITSVVGNVVSVRSQPPPTVPDAVLRLDDHLDRLAADHGLDRIVDLAQRQPVGDELVDRHGS